MAWLLSGSGGFAAYESERLAWDGSAVAFVGWGLVLLGAVAVLAAPFMPARADGEPPTWSGDGRGPFALWLTALYVSTACLGIALGNRA